MGAQQEKSRRDGTFLLSLNSGAGLAVGLLAGVRFLALTARILLLLAGLLAAALLLAGLLTRILILLAGFLTRVLILLARILSSGSPIVRSNRRQPAEPAFVSAEPRFRWDHCVAEACC